MTETKSIELNILLVEEIKERAKSLNKLLKDFKSLKEFEVFEIVETKCDEYHVTRDIFTLLNELCDRELTILDGKDKQKLIDEKLRDLIESSIQAKKRHADRWPDAKCPYREMISATEGLCLQDTPRRKYKVTASDCWACLKRRKMIRQETSIHTANGVKPVKDWMEIYRGRPW